MDLIIENFGLLLLIGLGFASWLKSRIDAKQEEEAERQAREEMARHLQELGDRPIERTRPAVKKEGPPPVPQKWSTNPNQPVPDAQPASGSKPPPLRDIFKEIIESIEPPPFVTQLPEREKDAYDDEPAPWEEFRHQDTSRSEIGTLDDPLESPMLQRQREMQDRLAEIKRETAKYKGTVAGAKETQRRVAQKNQAQKAMVPLGSLHGTLKDKRQVKRAIVLNEILGKPIALR